MVFARGVRIGRRFPTLVAHQVHSALKVPAPVILNDFYVSKHLRSPGQSTLRLPSECEMASRMPRLDTKPLHTLFWKATLLKKDNQGKCQEGESVNPILSIEEVHAKKRTIAIGGLLHGKLGPDCGVTAGDPCCAFPNISLPLVPFLQDQVLLPRILSNTFHGQQRLEW